MKYIKTNYPNIYTYETAKGKRYYVRRGYYLHGKKKEATKSNLKTLQEARAALAELERKIADNEFDQDKNLTCDQYWDIYSKKKVQAGKWTPDTEYHKHNQYNTHFSLPYGNVKLKDISRVEYEDYINSKLVIYSKKTVVQMHGIFNAMMNHAKHNKFITDNPIDRIEIGASTIQPRNKHVSLQEFKAWDSTAKSILDDYQYAIVRVTYYGLRRSEDAGLQIGKLTKRPDGRYLAELQESRTRFRPKGGGMKTEQSKRYCLYDIETSQYLEKAIAKSHEIAKKYGRILGPDDFLFLTDYKSSHRHLRGQPIRVHYINELFNKISKACDIHITPHMMRHFFSTQGQAAGISIEHMASALGHATSYMTQKYTHIRDEVVEKVSDSFMKAIQ